MEFDLHGLRIVRDLRGQPDSLRQVLRYQTGPGRGALMEAAGLLRTAPRVLITGMGASLHACTPFEYVLNAAGMVAHSLDSSELLHYRHTLCRGAVVVMVSRSGESVEIVKLLDEVEPACAVIGITDVAGSPLATRAARALVVNGLPDELVALQSYTSTLLTLLLLTAASGDQLDALAASMESVIPAMAECIEHQVERIAAWDDFFGYGSQAKGEIGGRSDPQGAVGFDGERGSPVYLLGRGPSCGSAAEGALLFHETSKAPAVGMPAGAFRHGPVEIVDGSFRALVFAPRGKTRELNLALASRLAEFGGKVRVIGPGAGESPGLTFLEVPDLPDTLAPLVEIVPVQVAAIRYAELRGFTPGVFRRTGQVTRDEVSF
jgi:glutamine---fructose-6-phosphate transaminase (isomerizing)